MTPGQPRHNRPCAEWRDRLERFVDGELPADQADTIRQHLRQCSSCLAEVQALAALNQHLRAPSDDKAPAALWSTIASGLDAPSAGQSSGRSSSATARLSRRSLMAIAASGVAVATIGAYAVWPNPAPVITASVHDFITYRAKGWTVDHAAPDGRALSEWAQSRVTFAVPTLKERFGAFEIGGIRLCWLLNRRLLGLTYANGEDRAVLYMMEAQGLVVPHAETVLPDGVRASVHHMKGHGVAVWSESDLVFVLVAAEKDFTRILQGAAKRADSPYLPNGRPDRDTS